MWMKFGSLISNVYEFSLLSTLCCLWSYCLLTLCILLAVHALVHYNSITDGFSWYREDFIHHFFWKMDISINNRQLAAMNCLNTVEVAATCRFSIAQMFGPLFWWCWNSMLATVFGNLLSNSPTKPIQCFDVCSCAGHCWMPKFGRIFLKIVTCNCRL